jgi:hypothetical protein
LKQSLDTGQWMDPIAFGSEQRSAGRDAGACGSRRQGAQLGRVAFGLGLATELTPPGAWSRRALAAPLLELRATTPQALAARWSGVREIGWRGTIDGAPFTVERGRAGDHRFVHGAPPGADGAPAAATRAVHHLSADARVLGCAPTDAADPIWWRELLDSTLFSVALLRGYEALHAGAIATPQGAIAIAAASGGGKSTLLSELIAGGAALLADDVLVLEAREGGGRAPLAHPAPPLMTVPAGRLQRLRGALAPAPETIAALAQERWVALPVHAEPLALAGVVTLNRAPGMTTELRRDEQPLAALVGSLLRFPRTRERERARFEMAGTIAAHVPVWRLDADPDASPERLAELLLAELASVVSVRSEPPLATAAAPRQPIPR